MKTGSIIVGAILAAGILVCSGGFLFGKEKKGALPPPRVAANRYTVPPLPESLDFCGEKVPLHDRGIREQFDREVLYNYYQPGNILYIIRLSHRYFPMIEAKLKARGIPEDMKYLCVAESNLQNLVSRVGATGFWQFMRETAPGYGLEVNANVDERYHVEKSTDAACTYLEAAYKKFGSWTAAAASYNCGQGGFNGFANFQQTKNYYDLMLPEETNRYIFRILTFKYFMEEPDKLGFVVNPEDRYVPVETKTVTVTNSIPNLVTFAKSHGITYKILRQYNPWIRGKSIPVRAGKKYEVSIPTE